MNNNQPKFDGAKWRCAKCQSVLATVAEVEELQWQTMEKKRVAVLELRAGVIKSKGSDKFEKPDKAQPFMRGASNQKQRIKRRKNTERQLELAQENSDIPNTVHAQQILERGKALASQASAPATDAPIKRLHAKDLPASVKCVKPGCDHESLIPSIRASPNVAQRGPTW